MGGNKIIRIYLTVAFVLLAVLSSFAQDHEVGIPVIHNFYPSDYGGHTQNFDLAEDSAGNIFVANFAGVLAYNGEDWELILTPEISRVTALESSARGKILVGGLNEVGTIECSADGKLFYRDLKPLIRDQEDSRFGEIKEIIATEDKHYFFSREKILIYSGNTMEIIDLSQKLANVFSIGNEFLIRDEDNLYYLFNPVSAELRHFHQIAPDVELTDIAHWGDNFLLGTAGGGILLLEGDLVRPFRTDIDTALMGLRIKDLLPLGEDLIAVGTLRNGIYFIDGEGNTVTWANRNYGLQNDYINKMHKDRGNRLWAALNNGISLVGYPWPWTLYNRSNGLKSGVISTIRSDEALLTGTYQGLYRMVGKSKKFLPIKGIETACWQFLQHNTGLLVATSEGVYRIQGLQASAITNELTLCLASFEEQPAKLYAGTLDGFSELTFSENGQLLESETKFSELGEVTELITDNRANLWIATLNGQLARYDVDNEVLEVFGEEQNLPDLLGNQFYYLDDKIIARTTRGLKQYRYESGLFEEYEIAVDSSNGSSTWPGLIKTTGNQSMWMTRGDETGLSHYIKDDGMWKFETRDFGPFEDFICRSIYEDPSGIMWLGGPSGLIRFDREQSETLKMSTEVRISGIRLNNDSIFYGGFGQAAHAGESARFNYTYRNVSFSFVSNGYNVGSAVQYSYRLSGQDAWSDWSTINEKEYQKLSPGSYTFYVRAKDTYGNLSEAQEFRFEVRPPWYFRWYMIVVYIVSFTYMVWQLIHWRLRNLVREKEKLENIVRKRTSEIREQRDENQKKSEELARTLSNLKDTQEELIRKEKLASVGQMTKGIVDRVINPLNYINNFSSLSGDLAVDMKNIIRNEKEAIKEENYEEILDIVGMLQLNIDKIQTHGSNTVRIIKAMEELLKNRSEKFIETDLGELVRQTLNRIKSSYQEELREYGIEVSLNINGGPFECKLIKEEFSKAVHELVDNAVQSVYMHGKKHGGIEGAFVRSELYSTQDELVLKVIDSGMGIPEKEIEKIFDPFFTTKTTAKGAGVGLYLVREIINLHKGTITVGSEVGKKTTFEVRLPKIQN